MRLRPETHHRQVGGGGDHPPLVVPAASIEESKLPGVLSRSASLSPVRASRDLPDVRPEGLARADYQPRSSVRMLVDVPYAMLALSCGRTYVYELLKRGELPAVKLGRSTRIPLHALEAFVEDRVAAAKHP